MTKILRQFIMYSKTCLIQSAHQERFCVEIVRMSDNKEKNIYESQMGMKINIG